MSEEERRGADAAAPKRVTPGIDAPGGYAEYLHSGERAMVRLPESADPIRLAPLADAGLAAYRACSRVTPSLGPSYSVNVLGVGELGHIAVQMLVGVTRARVLAVDQRETARRLALECGADEALTPEEADAELGSSALAVLDFVGSRETLAAGLAALRFGGRLILVGVGGELVVPSLDVVAGEKQIEGVYVGTYRSCWS